MLLFAGLDETDFKEIQEKVQTSNRKNLSTFSTISVTFLLIMLLLAAFNPVAHQNRIAYAVTLIIMTGILLYSRFSKRNILPAVYLFSAVIILFGIAIGTVTSPENTAATYIALLLAVPLIFVDRPVRIVSLVLLSNILFISMVILFKDPVTWSEDLINSLVFGVVSMILSSYMMKIKLSEFKNEVLISKLANVDVMTGLFNRNCFERSIRKYTVDAESCFCVYADANGLHEINNTKGHEAGDTMLIQVGRTLKAVFEQEDVYRMGGDEFMVCGTNQEPAEIERRIHELCRQIEEAGYSVSIGLEHQQNRPFDMMAMMNSAEKRMLQNKRRYYEQRGFDRRRNGS